MPAPLDLSFERFLKQSPSRRATPCKEAGRLDSPHRQPDDEDERDDTRDAPLLKPNRHHARRNIPVGNGKGVGSFHVVREIDEDYDGMDGSSDTEPAPQTPPSEQGSLDSPSVSEEVNGAHTVLSHKQFQLTGGSLQDLEGDADMDVDDPEHDSPPHSSENGSPVSPLSPSFTQEHPSIATIEDEEKPASPGSPSGRPSSSTVAGKVAIPRPKYRSYRDQHSTVPMPCLIDQCRHTSWMPKEREKHMDTHFHKRWQCGNCKKWYSTSYTLKRHSDSTHVPDACKGGYEAGRYTSVSPYWTMPEYMNRVRMPEPSDYLYPLLAPVFLTRQDLLSKGLLNKRPLPEDIKATADGPKKRTKRPRLTKKAPEAQPKASAGPSSSLSIVTYHGPESKSASTSISPVTPVDDARGSSPHHIESEEETKESPREAKSPVTVKAEEDEEMHVDQDSKPDAVGDHPIEKTEKRDGAR